MVNQEIGTLQKLLENTSHASNQTYFVDADTSRSTSSEDWLSKSEAQNIPENMELVGVEEISSVSRLQFIHLSYGRFAVGS